MAAMSRATRRIIVVHLTERGMNPAEIASELEVSRDTVRRDLADAPQPTPAESTPVAAPDAPGLHLAEDAQLRKDLNILAASYKAPAEVVARDLLHHEAEIIRDRVRARFAAAEQQV